MFRTATAGVILSALLVAPALAADASQPAKRAVATTPAPITTPDALGDAFFAGIQSGDIDGTYHRFFRMVMAQKPTEGQYLVSQTEQVLKLYGKPKGWELMHERQLGPSFVDRYYLLKLDGPVFFRLLMYKDGGEWTIHSLSFNDQFDKIIPQSFGN